MLDRCVSKVREVAGISRFHTHSAITSRDMSRPRLRKNSNASSNSLGASDTAAPCSEITLAAGSMR
ncbi:hypothetical protein D3C77_775810 [compost metagenome]